MLPGNKKDLENETKGLQQLDELTYRLIYENAADGIVLIDMVGRIVDSNKAWLNMVGYITEEIRGMKYDNIIPSEDLENEKILMDQMMKTGSTGTFESNYIHKNGQKIPISINMSLKKDINSNLLGQIAIVRDNTEKEKMERNLLRSANLAAIGTLAGGVAHEFNNILSVIMTWTALAKLDKSEENLKKAIDTIEKNCLRGANLISSLMDFSRINKLSKEVIDINALLEDSLVLFKGPPKAGKIKINKNYGDIPKLSADKRQLQQVFFHILSNSKDALHDMQGKINISTSVKNGKIKIQVIDNGIGIPESNMDKIFLPFFTTKGALGKSEIPGTGLGLYIAHTIVEQYDGTIEVESKVGKGTKVTIHFPIKEEALKEKPQKVVKTKKEGVKQKAKILILEDEKFILRGLKSFISLLGHQVFTARDANSALELVKQEKFDIAFLDIVMEGEKNGLDVFNEIKAREDETEVVLITASSIDEDLLEREKKGAFRLVTKPFALEELSLLIETILDKQKK